MMKTIPMQPIKMRIIVAAAATIIIPVRPLLVRVEVVVAIITTTRIAINTNKPKNT
jgi:hypothetical protein